MTHCANDRMKYMKYNVPVNILISSELKEQKPLLDISSLSF